MGQSHARDASPRPVVLVLGGGYAGTHVARLLDAENACFIVLVDDKESFVHTGAAIRTAVEKNFAQNILIPFDKLLKNGVVIHGVVSSVTARSVHLAGRVQPIPFDYLVIATGSKYGGPLKPNVRSMLRSGVAGANRLASVPSPRIVPPVVVSDASAAAPSAAVAAAVDSPHATAPSSPQYLVDTLEHYTALYDRIKRAHRIVIVGGGCVGIEVAGEIISKYGPAAVVAKPALDARGRLTPAAKEVVLIHSGAKLMNRQTGMRDKMRETILERLRGLGVKVVLDERVDRGSVRTKDGPCESELESYGCASAQHGSSISFNTTRRASTISPASPTSAAVVASYECDCMIECTGVKYDSSLFESDAELSTALDERGRIVVNSFFQPEGLVSRELGAASADGTTAPNRTSPPPASQSALHRKFSFHYPHVFAIGDCCVPREELTLRLNPQAYHAQKHALNVASNILNMLRGRSLVPYTPGGPQVVFVSLGPAHGVAQMPNRSNSLVGDRITVALKSRDLHVDANWALFHQSRARPSFHGHASQEWMEAAAPTQASVHASKDDAQSDVLESMAAEKDSPRDARAIESFPDQKPSSPLSSDTDGAVTRTAIIVDTHEAARPMPKTPESPAPHAHGRSQSSPVVLSPHQPDPSSPCSPHPNDSREMSNWALVVHAKLREVSSSPMTPMAKLAPDVDSMRVQVLTGVDGDTTVSILCASPIAPMLDQEQTALYESAMKNDKDTVEEEEEETSNNAAAATS